MYLVYATLCLFTVSLVSSQSNRCDQHTTQEISTVCTNCRRNIRVNCPVGFQKITRGRGKGGCNYRIGGAVARFVKGCYHTCRFTRIKERCCSNFWGQDCQGCPIGNSNNITCSGRGICNDGINGNGTCKCRGNVTGSSCDRCTLPQQYGSSCEQMCACVHGQCDNGVEGSGRCNCESGWGGALCDIALPGCDAQGCSSNARCINETGALECRCKIGYEGNGTSCTAIDRCAESNLCHQFAICNNTGPGEFACTCARGFSGDGEWCSPVDPCQTNNGGCSGTSTTCEYTGPGQSKCNCKLGYENLNATSCSLIDICGQFPNSTCDVTANCSTTDEEGGIQVVCSCPQNTVNRGLKCVSDLLTEMIKLNQTEEYANKLNQAIEMFSANYFDELSFNSLFTVLVPTDSAFGDRGEPDTSLLWRARARNHLVIGIIETDFKTESATSMHPLTGYNSTFVALRPTQTSNESNFFADLNYNNNKRGHFLTDAKPASNGLFYIIDTFLELTDSPLLSNYSDMTFTQALRSLPMTSRFYSFWMKSFFTRDWFTRLDLVTALLPTDAAFAALTADELKYLNSAAGLNVLDTLLRHHFVLQPLKTTQLIFNGDVETYSAPLPVNISLSGGILVGNEQAKISVSEIYIRNGSVIYLIDRVLIPPSIERLVDNREINITTVLTPGTCGSCERKTSLCEDNESNVSQSPIPCLYNGLVDGTAYGLLQGCQYQCNKTMTTTQCKVGFYGKGCWSCPGPPHLPCYENGICDQYDYGNGECECSAEFQGVDCSLCLNNSTYGPKCNQTCNCLHGRCINTISSRGQCVPGSCADGWSGENCDRRTYPCAENNTFCHQHAICQSDVNNTETCACEAGYTGDGFDCVEFNPCVDDENRGGCHVNAWCSYYGRGNYTCSCMALYEGDGKNCKAINRCVDGSNICDPQARCIYTGPGQYQCTCDHGYRGNGFLCTAVNSCLINNGGCNYRAQCASKGPGEQTCTCAAGYSGDGTFCVGGLLVEIGEHPQLRVIQGWIDNIDTVHDFFISINYLEVTAFLPVDDAWSLLSPSDNRFWINRDHLPYLFRHHIVNGLFLRNMLMSLSNLTTMLDSAPITIANVTDQAIIFNPITNTTNSVITPTLGKNLTKIVVPNLRTFDGLLHLVDSVLLPPRDVVHDYPHLLDLIQNASGSFQDFSLFLSYLNSSGVASRINSSQKLYTIFATPNNIFDPSKVKPPKNRFFSYHVIPGMVIRLEDFQSGQHVSTMAGEGYKVTLTRRDMTYMVNGQEVDRRGGSRTENGIIHRLSSSFLTPIKNRCDKPLHTIRHGDCQPCGLQSGCAEGQRRLRQIPCLPNFITVVHQFKHFCKLLCWDYTNQRACCKDFFGPECEPCPGGVGNVCYNNGECDDGIKGTGTCNCSRANFAGPACDECAQGYFGATCQSQCSCVNGNCSDGTGGSGECVCNEGYTGRNCDRKRPSTDNCGGICHNAAYCSSNGSCVCGGGYTGNGSICNPVNPCDQPDICHVLATCTYVSAGLHQCQCKTGYTGDGVFCDEINPCLNSSVTRCGANAECHHTGPNIYNCLCVQHYTGDGKTCTLIDMCETNHCHKYARCISQPGSFKCQCLSSFTGDGITSCIGNIYVEILSRGIYSSLFSDPSIVDTLSSNGSYTVFLFDDRRTDITLTNIIGCRALNRTELENTSLLYALDGTEIRVTTEGTSLLLNGHAKLIDNGTNLSNGYLYTINSTLNSNSSSKFVLSQPRMSFSQAVQSILVRSSANRYLQLLNFTDLIETMGDYSRRSWTFFIPNDDAFSKLSVYKQRQLANDVEVAEEYANYHMVALQLISPTDLVNANEVVTSQGSAISIECSAAYNGRLVINEGQANIEGLQFYRVAFNDGTVQANIFSIDSVLDPPSVGGRCDNTTEEEFEGTCTLCINSAISCPTGAHMIGQRKSDCLPNLRPWFPHTGYYPFMRSLKGCRAVCRSRNIIRKCCDNFYGRDCHPCPKAGLSSAVCAGNGKCDDGINGTGQCTCQEGYRGFSCERCQAGRFGPKCQVCNCSLHGRCEEGIRGNGFCHCDEGWTGSDCGERPSHNATCNDSCVTNAICAENGECQCKYGYTGDGRYQCDVIDFCSLNPCSVHATCASNLFQVTCTCSEPYVGDGYVCTGIDPCTNSTTAPQCHILARCVYVGPNVARCQCPHGYIGDGINNCISDFEQPQVPKSCAIQNGGCSTNAMCVEMLNEGRNGTTINCTCRSGFVGDGAVCNGNLYQILSQGLYQTGRFYQKVVRKNFLYSIKLRRASNMTLFVPRNGAFSRWRRVTRRALQRHVVSGAVYTEANLRSISTVVVDSRTAFPVQSRVNGSIFINGVEILTTNILATNGIIHIISGIIPRRISPIFSTTSQPRSRSDLMTPTNPTPPSMTSVIIDSNLSKHSTTLITSPTKLIQSSATTSSAVKVGISLGIICLILIVVSLIYWRKRKGMFVFRPLTDRFSGFHSDAAFEMPLGGCMDNPAYDSTSFRNPLEKFSSLDGEEDPMLFPDLL